MSVIRDLLDSTKLLINDSLATTGSNIFVGTQTLSGSIIPAADNIYDLGSPTKQWRDLYLSSASLYIDGTKVISSNTDTLTFTTDVGQSIKLLETGGDDITLQTDTGNIELKGTIEIESGKKITDSAATMVNFGDSIAVTGSILTTGTVDGIDLQAFSSSVAAGFANTTADYNELTNIPVGIISSSAQIASDISGSTNWNSVSSSILPSDTEVFDLGSTSKRWRDLYLSGSTIDLGGTKISRDSATGDIEFKDGVGNRKSLKVDELTIGTGATAKKLKVNNGKVQFTDSNDNVDGIDYTELTNIPTGIVSGSSQITTLLNGQDLTLNNLTVDGTQTIIDSTRLAIGDNIIELNAGGATNGGLLIKDVTAPNNVSGSLLWDSTNDYWIGGALGSEERIVLNGDTPSLGGLTTTGNVGIGTSSPNGRLNVQSSASGTYLLNLDYNNGTDGGGFYQAASTGLTLFLKDPSAATKVQIAPDGDSHLLGGSLGIGTSTPATKLDVNGTVKSLKLLADDGTVQTGFNGNSLVQISRGAAPSFLQFISPTNQQQGILFGDTDDTVMGSVRYDHTGDYMWFEANNAERMRIDSSGNVIVEEYFRVGGNVNNPNTFDYSLQTRNALIAGLSGTNEAKLYLHRDDVTIDINNILGEINFSGQDGGSYVGASIKGVAAGTWGSSSSLANLVFETTSIGSTSPTERMRIDSNGNVGIGNSSPSTKLQVDGTVTATALTETSALRFKENIQEDIDSSIIDKLRPVSYDWKENKEKDYGFIAEEVNELDSVLTTENEDGEMLGIKYTKLIPFLVKKIQEQEERIKQLENGNS